MNTALLAPLGALLGVIAGATLQFLYARRSEQWKQFLSARTQAYVDYIASITERARTPADSLKLEEIATKSDNALYRICIYGSKAALDAVGEFESLRPDDSEEVKQRRFLMLCMEMRRDTSARSERVDLVKLQRILWEPSKRLT